MVRKNVPQSVDTEKIKDSAAELAAALSDVGSRAAKEAAVLAGQAKGAATQAKVWAEPRYEAFVEWLAPRAEKAWNDSVQAAAPQVERVAVRAVPVVDTAHDKIVEEYLPRIVTAFNEAATRAAITTAGVKAAEGKTGKRAQKAAHKAIERATKEAAKASKSESSSGGGKKGLWLTVVALGSAGAGYVLWRRAQPQNDPWAEPWEQTSSPDFDGVARDAKYKVGDAAEAVGEAAGVAVARSREASEKLAGRAGEVREEFSGKVTDAVDKATEAAREATRKASSRSRGPKSAAAGETVATGSSSADTATEPPGVLPGRETGATGTDAIVDAAEETKPDQP